MRIRRTKTAGVKVRFEAFLKEHDIKHIKARVKHPQTNGKVEKWYDLYEKQRSEFLSFGLWLLFRYRVLVPLGYNLFNSLRSFDDVNTCHSFQFFCVFNINVAHGES
ncbi:MAG: hypothetical protein FFODKBPE_00551 [Candidatus Argoarchaeum ethanivorans]|uniref:Uncharacterized protein n=1 Tax=Candidatus Argoarchaeum ethanivorans TaxID=2608793 RepID=A0A811T8R5_9EURY|nr:MAG: hypothetical protein FFODKBPE_00551 [Candidatus Argoarchaeum ethanivorans]